MTKRDIWKNMKRKPCVDCGKTFDPVCMQFDHVPERGPKVGSMRKMFESEDIVAFEAELLKCDLICAICHALRTNSRPLSQEARAKISEKNRLRWQDPAKREKMSAFHRGKKKSVATRLRMSEAAKARTNRAVRAADGTYEKWLPK